MAQKDKVLEILALAQLGEQAKLAVLAHKWVGKPFTRAQAKAIIECYMGDNPRRVNDLASMLMLEKNGQERVRNDRQAVADADARASQSPMIKYRNNSILRAGRTMEIAMATFGQHVRDNFNEDTLALMSLIAGEDRSYRVNWMAAGFKPVRCALIEVITRGRPNNYQPNIIHGRFLLYRTGGRVLVARTQERELQAAWASQLPQDLVAVAPTLKADGYSFKSDLEGQELVVLRPDGSVFKRVEWAGRTVDA